MREDEIGDGIIIIGGVDDVFEKCSGLHVAYTWTTCGLHVDYMWPTRGLHKHVHPNFSSFRNDAKANTDERYLDTVYTVLYIDQKLSSSSF